METQVEASAQWNGSKLQTPKEFKEALTCSELPSDAQPLYMPPKEGRSFARILSRNTRKANRGSAAKKRALY
jgi:hypothetical protein